MFWLEHMVSTMTKMQKKEAKTADPLLHNKLSYWQKQKHNQWFTYFSYLFTPCLRQDSEVTISHDVQTRYNKVTIWVNRSKNQTVIWNATNIKGLKPTK